MNHLQPSTKLLIVLVGLLTACVDDSVPKTMPWGDEYIKNDKIISIETSKCIGMHKLSKEVCQTIAASEQQNYFKMMAELLRRHSKYSAQAAKCANGLEIGNYKGLFSCHYNYLKDDVFHGNDPMLPNPEVGLPK